MLRLFNVSNEKTFFGQSIDVALCHQLRIGSLHGDHAYAQIFCKAPLGRQTTAGVQIPW